MLNWEDPLATRPAAPAQPQAGNAEARADEAAKAPAPARAEAEELSAKPVNPDDKRVVNGLTDVNQLAPFKYPWAWNYFLNANKNHWTPVRGQGRARRDQGFPQAQGGRPVAQDAVHAVRDRAPLGRLQGPLQPALAAAARRRRAQLQFVRGSGNPGAHRRGASSYRGTGEERQSQGMERKEVFRC
ncbi:hypothetical protein Thpro_022124 [Acidihalobacter prosperus]|uniref:Uncharacterized protein n=1 Tax=Acidihalobacter prosperus TaxID=160660 RepID=A0A1A6C2Z2_9GAMM|nr:hypothetical protein Thpro_022124 [Acidihalobacter prosperus]